MLQSNNNMDFQEVLGLDGDSELGYLVRDRLNDKIIIIRAIDKCGNLEERFEVLIITL